MGSKVNGWQRSLVTIFPFAGMAHKMYPSQALALYRKSRVQKLHLIRSRTFSKLKLHKSRTQKRCHSLKLVAQYSLCTAKFYYFLCQSVCLNFETILWNSQSQVSLSLHMSHLARLHSRVLQTVNTAYKPFSNKSRTKELKNCKKAADFQHLKLLFLTTRMNLHLREKFIVLESQKYACVCVCVCVCVSVRQSCLLSARAHARDRWMYLLRAAKDGSCAAVNSSKSRVHETRICWVVSLVDFARSFIACLAPATRDDVGSGPWLCSEKPFGSTVPSTVLARPLQKYSRALEHFQ